MNSSEAGSNNGAEPFVLHAQVPTSAEQIIWLDELGDVVDGLSDLGRQIRGAEGLSEAGALLIGMPRLDRATLSEVGLDPSAGVVVWQHERALWISTRVANDGGAEHVVDVLRRRGHIVQPLNADSGPGRGWSVAARGDESDLRARLRLVGRNLLVRWYLPLPGKGTPVGHTAALQAYDSAPRMAEAAMKAAGGQVHLRLRLTPELGFHKAARRAIGPAGLLFGRLVDGLQRAEVDLYLSGGPPRLAVRLLSPAAATKAVADYHQGFLPEGTPALDLGQLLPDEVAALARVRLNPALLGMVPNVLRNRVLPASILSQLHRSLSALDAHALLVDQLDGQVAVGLLGVDDAAPADPRTWSRRGFRRTVGAFVAASLRSDQAARNLIDRMRAVLAETGAKLASRTLGAFAGFTIGDPSVPWTLLRRGRSLIWISGAGELERFERVARGRFNTLAKSAGTDLEREVAAGGDHWVGALVTTGRLSRSMRRRGIPAHFVRMVASVAAVAATLSLRSDGLVLEVTLRPRRPVGAPK